MKKIGFFWGSTSDNTKDAAEFMQEYLEGEGYEVDSKDIGEVDVEDLLSKKSTNCTKNIRHLDGKNNILAALRRSVVRLDLRQSQISESTRNRS